MSSMCVIISLIDQTRNDVDVVFGRVCLGESAVMEQAVELWNSTLSDPEAMYRRWHT